MCRARHRILSFGLVLSTVVVTGCDPQAAVTPWMESSTARSSMVTLPGELCGDPAGVRLLADETLPVGTVETANDETYLYVTYRTEEDWPIRGTALYVGDDLGDLPTAGRHGNPALGRFPMKAEHPPGTHEVTWRIALTELQDGSAAVAAFAEVGSGDDPEGAWGEGNLVSEMGSWAMWFEYQVQECVAPPTAVISAPADGTSVQAGTPLAFDGSGSEDPAGGGLVYSWDFGDGSLGGGAQIAHVYAAEGTYTATLRVVDQNGASDEDQVEVIVTPPPAPVATDGVVRGVVTDETGASLPGVTVALVDDGISGTTDENGEVVLENFPTGVTRVLRLSLEGYADDLVRVHVPADIGVGYFEGGLRPRNAPVVLDDAAEGGEVTGEDGAAIVLPPGALVNGAGEAVSGAVDVAITPVDVSGPELAAFPGGFEGVLPDGSTSAILSLGATEFVLSQGGEELQLAPGATATLRLPVYTPGADAGVAPVWSLDEATGLWIREGEGTVVDGLLEADVSHLSFWNIDFETEVQIVLLDCLAPPTVTILECLLGARTVGDGPRWAGQGVLSPDGTGLALPAATDVQLDAAMFAAECLARGTVTVPVNGDLTEVEIPLECEDGGGEPAQRLEYGDYLEAPLEEGETDRYVWAGEVGDEVRIDLDGTSLEGNYAVREPDGDILDEGEFGSGDTDLFFTLAEGGDHRIEVLSVTGDVGSYRIGVDRFVDEPAQALVPPATVEGAIGFPELETDVYEFEASAGDEISYAARTENRPEEGFFRFEGEIRLMSPSGGVLAQDPFGTVSREIGARALRLPEGGTYRVEVRSRNGLGQPDDPGAYELRVEPNPGTVLADGDVIPESISEVLDVDAYSFDFPEAETVRITLASVPPGEDSRDRIRIRIHDPDGNELVNSGGHFEGLDHWFVDTPPGGGQFRITVHGGSLAGPDYEIGLDVFEPEPAQTLVDGGVVIGEIGFPPEVDVYEFDGQAGEEATLSVQAAQADAFEGTVEIFDPDGVSLASGVFTESSAFGDQRILAKTGIHTVEVAGTDGIPFEYEIGLALAPPPDPSVLTPGDVVESSIDVTGGQEEFTFEGTAGQAVRIHAIPATSSDFTGRVFLTAPSTSEESVIDRFGPGGSGNVVVDLTETGTYTLRVEQAFTSGTGGYKLGLGTGIGRRDASFGPFGIGEVRAGTGSGDFEEVVPLPGGRILAHTGTSLFRYEADGATDATFGSSGEVDLQAFLGGSFVTAMRVQADGSIVVAAPFRTTEFTGWKVGRLDADGAPDPGFGTGGVAEVPIPGARDQLRDFPAAIVLVPDGTDDDLVVLGTSRAPNLGPRVVTLARLDPDGSLAASFGGGSNPLVTDLSLNVRGGVRQTDGRIVVGGSFESGNAIAYRFDPDGTRDLSFGASGEARVVYAGSGLIEGMTIRADDRVVLFGVGLSELAAIQLTASGDADPSFGTGGVVLFDYGHDERAFGAAVDDATGDLYLAGRLDIRDSGEDEGMLVVLGPDGSPEPLFAVGGLLLEDVPDRMFSVALDGAGGLLVGGRAGISFPRATLMRLLR